MEMRSGPLPTSIPQSSGSKRVKTEVKTDLLPEAISEDDLFDVIFVKEVRNNLTAENKVAIELERCRAE